jgi:hypothetical protein
VSEHASGCDCDLCQVRRALGTTERAEQYIQDEVTTLPLLDAVPILRRGFEPFFIPGIQSGLLVKVVNSFVHSPTCFPNRQYTSNHRVGGFSMK